MYLCTYTKVNNCTCIYMSYMHESVKFVLTMVFVCVFICVSVCT